MNMSFPDDITDIGLTSPICPVVTIGLVLARYKGSRWCLKINWSTTLRQD